MRRRERPRRAVERISKIPPRAHFGWLAEDYDGIGQYVMVTLSNSSTAAAYKARVAAGDFGGGRTFPAGTPVPVFSSHGRLEILLGNIPIGCIDTFTRVVSSSVTSPQLPWGTSEIVPVEYVNTVDGPQWMSVDGSRASFSRNDFDGDGTGHISLPVYPRLPVVIEFDMEFGFDDGNFNSPFFEFFIGNFDAGFEIFYGDFDTPGVVALYCDGYNALQQGADVSSTFKVADSAPFVNNTFHCRWTINEDYSLDFVIGEASFSLGPSSLIHVQSADEFRWLTFGFFDAGLGSPNESVFFVDNLKITPCKDIDKIIPLLNGIPDNNPDFGQASDYSLKWELPIEVEVRFKVDMAATNVSHAVELSWWGPDDNAPWYGNPNLLLGVSNQSSNNWYLVPDGGSATDVHFNTVSGNWVGEDGLNIGGPQIATVDNVWCLMKFRIERYAIYGKTWKDGTAEPDWQARDSGLHTFWEKYDLEVPAFGRIGIRFACQATNSEFLIDYMKLVTGYDGQTDYIFDNFDRSVASGWGNASSNGSPYTQFSDDTGCSVNGSAGRFLSGTTNPTRQTEKVAAIDWGS